MNNRMEEKSHEPPSLPWSLGLPFPCRSRAWVQKPLAPHPGKAELAASPGWSWVALREGLGAPDTALV